MEAAARLTGSPDVSAFSTPAVVSVVLFPSFSMMALASTTEPLRAANLLSGKALYRWSLVSLGAREVVSSSGFRLTTDHADLALPPSDLTLIIASLEFDHLLQPSLLRRLPLALQASKAIGGVSHGSIVLARAGLLDGYRCTSHWDRLKELNEMHSKVRSTREVFCIDRNRWTSSGGTAAMDMMLTLVRAQHGQALALNVANNFIHSRMRQPGELQPMEVRWRYGVKDRRLARAIGFMEQSIESPLPLSQIAELAGLSTRQMQRLFLAELDKPPEQFFIDMRLRAANDLLAHTDDSIGDIAHQCGFGNPSHFARTFLSTFGIRPGDARRNAKREHSPPA
jgi:transcriptional regulator GlxA family with amidase domain